VRDFPYPASVDWPVDAVTHFVSHYGLWVVLALVLLETAGGPFVPGETAFIVASALASQGHGHIELIIGVTVAAAVAGTTIAYVVGSVRGRELLALWPRFERLARPGLDRSEGFFRRHGAKALYLGRFVPVLRATLGWMAGVSKMPPRRFFFWNVAGAVSWGCAIGIASYYVGEAVVTTVERDAAIGAAVIVAILLGLLGAQFLRRRLLGA
jgi:membrane protein DedA with SNARE-associated domain